MIRMTHLVVVLVLGLLAPLTSYASADEIRQDALKGDTAAQYEMGILYEFGFNLADHETEALAWYSVAAERGSAPSARRRTRRAAVAGWRWWRWWRWWHLLIETSATLSSNAVMRFPRPALPTCARDPSDICPLLHCAQRRVSIQTDRSDCIPHHPL